MHPRAEQNAQLLNDVCFVPWRVQEHEVKGMLKEIELQFFEQLGSPRSGNRASKNNARLSRNGSGGSLSRGDSSDRESSGSIYDIAGGASFSLAS